MFRNCKNRTLNPTLALIAIMLSACDANKASQDESPRPVKATTVTATSLPVVHHFSGVLAAQYQAELAFEIPGILVSRDVEQGGRIQEGKQLASLDDTDHRQQLVRINANLVAAQSNRKFVASELSRAIKLSNKGFTSETRLEQLQSLAQTAESTVIALESELVLARSALAKTRLLAPRGGIIGVTLAEVGQFVNPGQPIVSVVTADQLEVRFPVPTVISDTLTVGFSVQVRATNGPTSPQQAVITKIAPAANPASGTVEVTANIVGPLLTLRPGLSVEVDITLGEQVDVLTVPLSAVIKLGKSTAVWVVDPQTLQVSLEPVTLGNTHKNQVVIIRGLSQGEQVVVAGAHDLSPLKTVTVLPNSQ